MRLLMTALLLVVCGLQIQAQSTQTTKKVVASSNEVVTANAGTLEADGLRLSFTAGELIVGSGLESSSVSLSQGFQPPATITSTSVSQPIEGVQLSVYPNPAMDFIQVDFVKLERKDAAFALELHNLKGQKLISQNIAPGTASSQLDLEGLSNGQYLLTVLDLSAERKTCYQINKTK